MTFEDALKIARQRIGVIVIGLLIGVGLSLAAALTTPVTYTASAVAYVRASVPPGSSDAGRADAYYAASQLATQKVKAFMPVFTSEPVAQETIKALGLTMTPAEMSRSISVTNEKNALTITVLATAPSAQQAQETADEIIRQADAQIKILEGEDSPVGVVLMSPASLSATTRSPSIPRYVTIGAILGTILGYAAALVQDLLDKRIRSQSDVTSAIGSPVLATIPRSTSMVRGHSPQSQDHKVEESLRKLRTNLRYANIDDGLKTLIISSPVQGEGKSTVSANLARVMALSGKDVILVEGDLRRPTMRETFCIGRHQPGLSQLLAGAAPLQRALVSTPIPGLQVIPAGDTPPNPSELLGSTRMSELLSFLAEDHTVIVDAPPVLPVTDAVELAEHADGVLLVVRSGRTTEDQLRQTAASITHGSGKLVGIVLNQLPSSAFDRLRYGETVYGYTDARQADAHPEEVEKDIPPAAPPQRSDATKLHVHARHTTSRQIRTTTAADASTTEFIAMLERQKSPVSHRWAPIGVRPEDSLNTDTGVIPAIPATDVQ